MCAPFWSADAHQIDVAEGALIEAADVSGLSIDHLSPGLQQAIRALEGQPVDRERLAELTARIEQEHPDVVAAVRSVPRGDNAARIVFLVARIDDEPDLASNINARYTVESVEIEGIDDDEVSPTLRDELQGLVGQRLDPDKAERLNEQLEAYLPRHNVTRQISRGNAPGTIRVVYKISVDESARWIRFAPSRSKVIYHSKQGWSGVIDAPLGGPRDHRVALGFALGNNDDLIEEYSGYRLRIESRRLATDRLGAALEVSWLRQSWEAETISALASQPEVPEAYRTRLSVDPRIMFAFHPRLRLTAGVSIADLESQTRSPESQMANALVASIGYDQQWEHASDRRQQVDASYELRRAGTALQSDLEYTRHFAQARYEYRHEKSEVITTVALGRSTGRVPLFERFSLGDTATLRGWNKYAIAPAGGTRVLHHSIEYRYRRLALFLDSGSVWDQQTARRFRFSTGFGVHGEGGFLTLGFPLNSDDTGVVVMLGARF